MQQPPAAREAFLWRPINSNQTVHKRVFGLKLKCMCIAIFKLMIRCIGEAALHMNGYYSHPYPGRDFTRMLLRVYSILQIAHK